MHFNGRKSNGALKEFSITSQFFGLKNAKIKVMLLTAYLEIFYVRKLLNCLLPGCFSIHSFLLFNLLVKTMLNEL